MPVNGGDPNARLRSTDATGVTPAPKTPQEIQAEQDAAAAYGAAHPVSRGYDPKTGQQMLSGQLAEQSGVMGTEVNNPANFSVNGAVGTETNLERIAQQHADFLYGNNGAPANADIAAARGIGSQYGTAFGGLAAGAAGAFGGVAGGAGAAAANAQGRGLNAYQGDNGMYQAGTGLALQDRGMQTGAYGQLMNFANQGPGPSAAQAQLAGATDANTQNALALARSGRGMGGSQAMMHQALGQNAATQQQASNQMAALRAQEAATWRGQQAGALTNAGQLGSQTVGADTALGGLGLQSQLGQSDVALRGTGLNDQTGLGYTNAQTAALTGGYGAQSDALGKGYTAQMGGEQQAFNVNQADLAGRTGYEGNVTQNWGINSGHGAAAGAASNDRTDKYIGTGLAVGATALSMMSDVRAKKNIVPLDADATEARYGLGDWKKANTEAAQGAGSASAWHELMAKYGVQSLPAVKPSDVASYAATPLPKLESTFKGPAAVSPKQPDTGALDLAAQSARNTPGYTFDYKDPEAHGHGRFTGPMAQDLAADPVARSAVVKQPDGSLAIDGGRLAAVNTAQNHSQQAQIDELKRMLDQSRAGELNQASGGVDSMGNRF